MAIPELLDEEIDTDWGPAESWDLLVVRSMLLRMLQLKREAEQLGGLRKRIAEDYKAREEKLVGEYNGLRTNVKRYIELHGNEPVRLPDVGTAYLQGKDAKPKLVLGSQEAAVSRIAGLPEAEQAAFYTKVFSPQAYLEDVQPQVEALLARAAVDADGKLRLAEDGTAVVTTDGELVPLPPGVLLQVPEAHMALRPA